MTALFITILNMSITASFVALAVMLARVLLKKAPKIFSYALWSVVLFRLMFPFSIESIFSFMPASPAAIPQDIIYSQAPSVQTGVQLFDIPVNTVINNVLPPVNPTNSVNPIHVFLEVAAYAWLAGFIALLLYAVMGYIGLRRRVRYATLVRGNIFETDKIKTPFVLGFIRPKIYFPLNIGPAQQDYILKHEQTHIKRRDYIIKPFAFIVLALHWFNPVIWISYLLMSKDMEMSCDEAVLRKTNEDIRGDYSASLLSLSVERVSLLNPIAFGESNVKERVVNVLCFKKTAKWISVVSFIFAAVFLVGFASDTAFYQPASEQEIERVTERFEVYVYELHSRIERHADTISPEEAAAIAARYIWDNFGVNIDGSVVYMTFQYVQARMRTHADDDATVGAWSFLIGERGVLTATNMDFTFLGILNAATGEVISINSAGNNEIIATVPFSERYTHAFPETRQILLTNIHGIENHDEVFEFSYCPQTSSIWITNTGERVTAPLNHINVRCADTGEIFHIEIIETVNDIPHIAFFVEITDTGRPILIAIDNTTQPNIIANGGITIGMSARTPATVAP
ncbi:MAG: M56 family metallopeptidase [Defluviitaleaceae bacterium]|nr:M56 family metallopeptidase [Defluviitaleaceae bacterium]